MSEKIIPIETVAVRGGDVTDVLRWKFDSLGDALEFIGGYFPKSGYSFESLDSQNVVTVKHTYTI
jgi:hypothetical protein